MGSLRKLATGIWLARLRYNGKDYRKRFNTKGETQRWMRQLEIDLANTEAFIGQQGWGLRLKDLMQQYRLQITPTKKGARFKKWLVTADGKATTRGYAATRVPAHPHRAVA